MPVVADDLVADVDPVLLQPVVDVAQRVPVPEVQRQHRTDDLGRRPEVAETGWACSLAEDRTAAVSPRYGFV